MVEVLVRFKIVRMVPDGWEEIGEVEVDVYSHDAAMVEARKHPEIYEKMKNRRCDTRLIEW